MSLKEDYAWIIVTKDRTKVICNKEPQKYEFKEFNNIGNSFIRTFKGELIAKNSLKHCVDRLCRRYFQDVEAQCLTDKSTYYWLRLDVDKAINILLEKYIDVIKIRMTLDEVPPSTEDINKVIKLKEKKLKEEERRKQRDIEREKHIQELIDKGIIDEQGHILDKYRDII